METRRKHQSTVAEYKKQIMDVLTQHKFSDLSTADEDGNAALQLTMKILLDRGIDPNIKNKKNEAILLLAVLKRAKKVIDILVPNKVQFDHSIGIHLIEDEITRFTKIVNQPEISDDEIQRLERESADYFEWLIKKGFNFDRKNKQKQSVLLMVLEYNLQHILPVFLKYTKDINFVDKKHKTLLHLFIERNNITKQSGFKSNLYSGLYAADIVKILLDRGVSVDAEADYAQTPLELAVEKKEDIVIVEAMIERSTNVNKSNTKGVALFCTMIMKWIESKKENSDYYMNVARAMIANGININERDERGKAALSYAVIKCKLKVVEFLQENGADFNVTTKNGDTLMHLFIDNTCPYSYDNVEEQMLLLDLLLDRVTNILQKNSQNQTVFNLVIKNWGYFDKRNIDFYMKIVRTLLAKGANVDEPGTYGKTPLGHAVEERNLYAIELLQEKGADFSVTRENGETLMHLLAGGSFGESADKEIFNILMSNGCSVNAKTKSGTTPLHLAVEKNYYSMLIQELLERGADVNCRNDRRETPLLLLASRSSSQIKDKVERLLKYGANVNATDCKGRTALQKLLNISHWDLIHNPEHMIQTIQVLLSYGADSNTNVEFPNRLRHKYNAFRIKNVLLQHWMKLDVANLKSHANNDHRDLIEAEKDGYYYEKCLTEIEKLKTTFIDNHTTLYNFLHIDPNSRRAYINNEQLKALLDSSKLEQLFPEYSVLIFASYQEAITRKSLLEPARKAWFELTEIRLPDVCLDLIFSFLSNADLFNMVEKN